MKILKEIIFPVLFGFLSSNISFAQEAEEHFEKGVGYLETRHINEAIDEFKNALPLFKEDQEQLKAEAYSTLAYAYNWKGVYKAAITACNKALEINPDLADAHYNLGFAYREEGNGELAKKEFALYDKLLKKMGEYVEVPEKPASEEIEKYVVLGDNYFEEGKLDEAIEEYKKALEIKPRDDILNKLGQVHQQKRLINKTGDSPAKTDKLTGEEPVDKTAVSTASDETTQITSTEELLKKASLYYNKGMIDEAIEKFKEALRIDPEDIKTHYNLGNAYADKGMLDEAISTYKKALEIHPGFIDACLSLGMLYLDTGMIDEAISLYKQAVKAHPDDSFLCFHLGEAYAMNEQYKEAITEYNKAISINPMDPETQYRLAESYYETEQYEKALEHATQADELGYITDPEFMINLKKKTGR